MITIARFAKTLRAGAFCALAMGAAAHAQNSEVMRNNNLAGDWSRWSYVDFGTTTIAGHANHPTGTFGGVGGLKYKSLQLDGGNLISGQQCFEVFTAAPTFLPGVTADTRIWITSHLGSPTPRPLNDNSNGTFSAARVWLKGAPGSYVNLAVAAKNAGWNTMHFNLVVRQLPLTEASCTTGQAKPWVKVINGTMTISANAT